MDVVAEVRRFNRFYTRLIGLLDPHLPDSGLSLPEGRVLYEVATQGETTAAELSRCPQMDKAQLSRLLRVLSSRRLLRSQVDPRHAKRRLLSLTAAGQVAFRALDHGTRLRMTHVLEPLRDTQRDKLVSSLRSAQGLFEKLEAAPPAVRLRAPVPGDIGWVIHRQAVLYAQEYDWDWTYEALIARILGDFATQFDPGREDAWIAERGGNVVGSIFLMRGDSPEVAKLRLLYVEPGARGLGLGRRLVEVCIERARALGYRRLTLWTNDVLLAARHIYESTGFRLVRQENHHSFGKDLVGQTWDLDL